MNWDDAGWLHHALVSIELAGRKKNDSAGKLDATFVDLRDKLSIDRTDPPSNSPRGYDPKIVVPTLRDLAKQLRVPDQ
jgi:hypothetical protein